MEGMGSGVRIALFGEGKWVKAFVAVESVGVFGALEPVDDQIGYRGGKDLVPDLEGVAGDDDIEQDADGVDPAEGKDDDEGGVHGLADDGGTDGAGPELAAVG